MSDIEQHIKRYFLEIDEESDAILGLNVLLDFLKKAEKDKHYWVWVFISLHKSVQSFMVLALQGTDSDRLLKPAREGKEPRMHDFPELYRMIKEPGWMMQYTDSQIFGATGTQDHSISLLNTVLRNNFIHFSPKSWLIGLAGMPRILEDCLDVIEFLALKSGNVFWNSESDEKRLTEVLPKLRRKAKRLRKIYE